MNWLIRLYPRAWQRRYGAEFAALLEDLAGRRSGRLRVMWDIGTAALDAHWAGRHGMKRLWADLAVRTGMTGGLIISAALTILAVLTNVVFPGGPEQSDADPEVVVPYLITLALIAGLLAAIGGWGARRTARLAGGAKSGAAAGAIVAVMITIVFVAMNNLFLDIVSQQHDKRVAFAASGWTSMRAFLTVTQLQGGLVLIPVLAIAGGALGLLGALVSGRRSHTT